MTEQDVHLVRTPWHLGKAGSTPAQASITANVA